MKHIQAFQQSHSFMNRDQQNSGNNPQVSPSTHSSTQSISSSSIQRQRIKTACDYCRRRKSKCNGETPCSNCVQFNRVCSYTTAPKERKKRVSKTPAKTESSVSRLSSKQPPGNEESISGLTSRLAALENLLTRLAHKLDNNVPAGSPPKAPENASPNDPFEDIEDLVEVDIHSALKELSIPDERSTFRLNNRKAWSPPAESVKSPAKMKEIMTPQYCVLKTYRDRLRYYFGPHSILGIFSAKGMGFLKARMEKSDDIALPIRNLPIAYNNAVDSSMKMWVEPDDLVIQEDIKTYFNKDRRSVVFELLERYYQTVQFADFLCDLNQVRELFQRYYYGLLSDSSTLDSFEVSEYLIMNIAISLCISNKSGWDTKDPINYPTLSAISNQELNSLRQDCFSNAVSCYEKISMQCEGVITLQAISLLILYVESSYIVDFHMNNVLASTLIRHGFALGLNQTQSYVLCTPEQSELRRKLVWFMEYIDIDYAYRTGKFMMINYDDLGVLSEYDNHFLSVPIDPFSSDAYKKNHDSLIANCKESGAEYYHAYYMLILNRIRLKSYHKLYSAKALTFSQTELMDSLDEINGEMQQLAQLMDPETRPMLYHEKIDSSKSRLKDWKDYKSANFKYTILNFQLSYFAHLSLINRVPFGGFSETNERLLKFGNTSMEAARTILHLVADLNKSIIPKSVVSWISFYPFMAYCSLLAHTLAFSTESSAVSDSLLLIKVSMNFFAFNDNGDSSESSWENRRIFDGKNTMLDLVTRVLLRVLVSGMEPGSKFLDEVPGLKEHLATCRTIYPDLFKEQEGGLQKPLNLVFNDRKRPKTKEKSSAESINFETNSVSPTDSTGRSVASTVNAAFDFPDLESGINLEEFNDETFTSMLYSQMYNMPTFLSDGFPEEISSTNRSDENWFGT